MFDTAFRARPSFAYRLSTWGPFLLIISLLFSVFGCSTVNEMAPSTPELSASPARSADELFVVDCLLPGQVKKLGRSMTYLTPRRPIKTSAQDCGIRGGEYVAYDRSDYATALKVWLPLAQEEDKVAQTYVGEIYEKGLGVQPDYALASEWYRKAATQGYPRAQINLGYLYEKGLGVQKDPETALNWYRKAAGLSTAITIDPVSINTEERKELQDLRGEVERRKRESESLRQQLEQTRQQAEQTQQKLERREGEVETERQQVEKVRQELKTQKKQAEAAHNDAALKRLEAQQKQREADLARQQQDITQLRKERGQLEVKAEGYRHRLEELNARLEKEKSKPPPVALPDNTEERKELQDLRGEVERRKRESESLRQQLEQTRQQAEQTQRKLERREGEVETERQQVEKVRQEWETQKKQAEAAHNDAALKRLDEQQKQREADLARQQQDITQLRKERGQLEVEAEGYRRRLEELNAQLEKEKSKPPPVALSDPTIKKPLPPPPGNYYALIIGNKEYIYWPKLDTPQNDAVKTDEMLRRKYGFKTKVLLNAKRYDILIALNELQKKLTEKDSLLIYYAGHGQLDDKGTGYWVPVDGEKDGKANWIQNLRITDILNTTSAKHVLVVADTCYSGVLTLSSVARLAAGISVEDRDKQLKDMVEKRSRIAMTSGGLQPVKSGGGSQSLFAIAFLDVLRANDEVLTGLRLYQEVSARVAHAAVGQVPQYAPIQFAGHEAGDFVFVPVVKEYEALNRTERVVLYK